MNYRDIINKDETVKEVVLRHWMSIAGTQLLFAAMGAVGLYGVFWLGGAHDQFGVFRNWAWMGAAFLTLIIFSLLLLEMNRRVYRENCIIVTDHNVYEVIQTGLYSRKVTQFELGFLQDVTVTQNGFLATSFNYGTVEIETAGEQGKLIFDWAPSPKRFAAHIMRYHKESTLDSPTAPGLNKPPS